jgi:hypothetical protein
VPNITGFSRSGQVNAGGSADALFLKVFAGEILTAFKNSTVTQGAFLEKTISSGKSASFPLTGIATAGYHTPGTDIFDPATGLLSGIKHQETLINIDDLLVSATFIANMDEAKNHFDVRSVYAAELGSALALKWDSNVLQKAIKAARISSPKVTGLTNAVGTVLDKGATVATTASVLAAAINEAGIKMDEKNVPADGRICYLRPAHYGLLTQYTLALDKQTGGSGSYADGKVYRIGGVELRKTNQLPNTDLSGAVTGDNNGYNASFLDTICLVAHRGAVGTVKLLDLAVESEYDMDRQGHKMLAKYAVGHGDLRPECAVEITKA